MSEVAPTTDSFIETVCNTAERIRDKISASRKKGMWMGGNRIGSETLINDNTVETTDGSGNTYSEVITLTVNDLNEVAGTGGDDKLSGTDGVDYIDGGDGDDKIEGKGGDDTLLGGEGGDELKGGEGNDRIYGGAGGDKIEGDADDDTLDGGAGVDELKGGSGYDTLYGGEGDDALDGGSEDDILSGGAGADHLKGGSGFDTADYTASGVGVSVDLASGTATGGDAQGDTFEQMENLTGSSFDDILIGDDGDNVLDGGLGNDTLSAGDGNDLFMFHEGDGNDNANGGTGAGWTDTVNLMDSNGGNNIGQFGVDWTMTLTSGSIVSQDSNNISLTQDADGSLMLQDGSTFTFVDLEQVNW
ncbi:MAG: calcium-binding protein [Rhodobacteraceae bacterium]|nr:calcium-binding protein [Paracoccaceae bacterium]